MDRHLSARADHRTFGDMASDVEQYTIKEWYWGMAMRYDLIARGHPCSIQEHGVDNTGRLIMGRLPNDNVDKKINFEDGSPSILFEIKGVPNWCNGFHTLKKLTVESCLRQKALFFAPQTFRHFTYGNKALREVKENFPLIRVRSWGNKPCYRPEMDFIMSIVDRGLVSLNNWTPLAQKYINRFKHILDEERRTEIIK